MECTEYVVCMNPDAVFAFYMLYASCCMLHSIRVRMLDTYLRSIMHVSTYVLVLLSFRRYVV